MKFFRSLSKIQALSFDLDDTLYENHPRMLEAEKSLQKYLASHYPNTAELTIADWRSFKRSHLKSSPALMSDMGELRRLTLETGLSTSGYQGQELNNAVNACFEYFYHERSNFQVDKNICSLLAELGNVVPLVAITNGNVNLDQIGISDFFSHCFKANMQQPMKPHRKMFDLASESLNLAPKNILHVGDNLEKDIMGAIAAGMQSAWYACDRPMQLNNERTSVIPHVQLDDLNELRALVL